MAKEKYDFLIIGAGGAGLAAGMYGARLGLKTLILGASHGSELPIGGVITTTNIVENYPGFIKLSGPEIADELRKHAESYDLVTIKEEKAISVEKKNELFFVKGEKLEYEAKALLFATGTKWRKLPETVKGGQKFENKGVAYCALCQPPGEELIANSNILPIEKVTPSTNVLTAAGDYQRVAGFTRRDYSGELIRVTPRFFCESVELTPEHPVLSLRVEKGIGKDYWKNFKFGETIWKEAKELSEKDCVLYPIIKETKDVDYIRLSDFLELRKIDERVIPHKKTHTAKMIKDKIPINKEVMRLFGYYLAEGSAVKHEIRFCFNKNENSYIDDVVKIIRKNLMVEPHVSKVDKYNVKTVSFYSKVLCDLFKVLFDKYAHSKGLPHFMMILSKEKQAELLKGLWRGDGCTRDKDFCLVTVSRKMAYQVRDLLLRQGVICSLQKIEKDKLENRGGEINGRDISFTKDKYHVVVGGQFLEKMSNLLGINHPLLSTRQVSTKHAWINHDFAVLPIRKIEKNYYKGEVISVAVENNSSYVAKNFIVHNCDAPLFKNKIVCVVGGSDSAVKDALVLAEHAKKVYIIYRGEKVRAEPINLQRIEANDKIEVVNNSNIVEVVGKNFVEKVILDKEYNGSKEISLQGVFVAIGHIVLSDLAKTLNVKLNEKSEIIIDHKTSETNVKGVFAAGDVADKPFKQLITGVAEGCTAAYSAYEYITKNRVEGN